VLIEVCEISFIHFLTRAIGTLKIKHKVKKRQNNEVEKEQEVSLLPSQPNEGEKHKTTHFQ
jgi:hypothetical protein